MDILKELVNPSFDLQLGERKFSCKKANIEQVIRYHEKIRELGDDPFLEQKLVKFVYYLIISSSPEGADITEEYIGKNLPGAVDTIDSLILLGFMNPQKKDAIQNLSTKMAEFQILAKSSAMSRTEQDGGQTKSES